MFESLFGAEMPLAVRFFLAFLIVLGLIGATAWAVRRFGTGRLGGASSRGRQPRLAVIEYANVDARRRLMLVRRDNVEHLLIIGGPTDVVVEANIVRAVAAPRDVAAARPPAVEPLPRAIPLPETGNGSWPLQPEPTLAPPPPRPAPKSEPAPEEPAAWPLAPQAEAPPPRPQRDTLSALADELSTRPLPAPPRDRALGNPRAKPAEPRSEPRAEPRLEPRAEPRPEPRQEPRVEPRVEPRMPAPQPAPTSAPTSAEAEAADQSLAEMAHRLEAALRKPGAPAAEPRAPQTPPRAAALSGEQAATPEPATPRTARVADPKPARSDAKPSQGTALYDSLEQEMASLLGRPTNKT